MEIIDEGKIVKVDGQSFQKLSPRDRGSLMAGVKASRRALNKENLKEGGITGAEYVNEIDAFDQSIFGDAEFWAFLQSVEGRAEIIARACEKANPDKAVAAVILDNLVLDQNDDFSLAAILAGVKVITKADKPDGNDGDDEPRPSVAGS